MNIRDGFILIGLSLPLMLLAAGGAQTPGPQRREPLVTLDPDLVRFRVTINAPLKSDVPRLQKKDFRIWEEGVEQEVTYFTPETQPMSLAVIYSITAGSDLRNAPRVFLENNTRGSEYFLMTGDTVVTSFTTDITKLPRIFRPDSGSIESVYVGLDVLKESAYSRKALLIIADGVAGAPETEFYRRYTIRQDVPVYMILMSDGAGGFGDIALEEMTVLTGGESYYGPADAGATAENYCLQIAQGLKNQYTIGYIPKNRAKDGKWRKLRVGLNPGENTAKLTSKIKSGYYAPKG